MTIQTLSEFEISLYERNLIGKSYASCKHKHVTGYQLTPDNLFYTILGLLMSKGLYNKKKTFIDLGAGFGVLVRYIQLNGIFKEIQGIEYDEDKVSVAQNDLLMNVIQGDVSKIKKLSQDIIYTFNICTSQHKIHTFGKIIKSMQKGQIFIESYDAGQLIYKFLKKQNFTNIIRCGSITIGVK